MNNEQDRQYSQMKGEYISLMASLENTLTMLLVEYLNVRNHREAFSHWFLEASIPFSYKVSLLKLMEGDNVIISTNFPNFWIDLDELQKFRNTLAHSFEWLGDMMTTRGKKLPKQHTSIETLREKLARLKKLEDTVKSMYVDEIIGTPDGYDLNADDY